MNSLTFFVPGEPKTQGSMKAFVVPYVRVGEVVRKPQRAMVTHDKRDDVQSWRSAVAGIAYNAARKHGFEKIEDGPITLELLLLLPKPKSVKRAVPYCKPDGGKLQRAIEDALTGVLWADDAQVTDWAGSKRYAEDGQETGAQITVSAEARHLNVGKQLELMATTSGRLEL